MASTASTASVASMTYTTSFHQKNDWYWWLDHSWHHNDQYLSLIVDWILENPIFHWCLVSFPHEAVEASPCYFFQNWLMKLKCPNLLNPLDTIIQENYQPFNSSEPFRITRFKMRHPVSIGKMDKKAHTHFWAYWVRPNTFTLDPVMPLLTTVQVNLGSKSKILVKIGSLAKFKYWWEPSVLMVFFV